MPLMCEECKCSTYYNDETDMYSCENDCACCNDPDYKSDGDKLVELIEYIKIHLISLQQDSEKLAIDMDNPDLDMESWEYKQLEIQDIGLNGKMFATAHILSVAKDILNS